MSLVNVNLDVKANEKKLTEIASLHSSSYQNSKPCPHIKFDHFLNDEILEKILLELLDQSKNIQATFKRKQENLKKLHKIRTSGTFTKQLFVFLNSPLFLNFLEKLTGIKALIPDPYYIGGGIHEVENGGHLDIHADFNFHPKLNLERRINLLIYLNKDWKESYGGQFELWDEHMQAKQKSFENTGSASFAPQGPCSQSAPHNSSYGREYLCRYGRRACYLQIETNHDGISK